MLKKELVRAVAADSGQTQETVRAVFDSCEKVVLAAISRGKSVMLFGLGKLVISARGPKRARHMRTGEAVIVPPRRVPMLRPSDGLSDAANQVAS